MKDLKTLRKIHSLTQDELSRRTGIARRRLSHFESGHRRPRPEEATALKMAFGSQPDPQPEESHGFFDEAARAVPNVYRGVARHLVLEPELQRLPLESVWEAVLLLRLLERFDKLCFPSPLGLGFRVRGVVDPEFGHLLSDLPHPVIKLSGGMAVLTGPTLDTPRGRRRLGFLVRTSRGWLDLEVGGDSVWDSLRSRELGFGVVRFTRYQLLAGLVWDRLEGYPGNSEALRLAA